MISNGAGHFVSSVLFRTFVLYANVCRIKMCYKQGVYIEMWVITNIYCTPSCVSFPSLCRNYTPQLCRCVSINSYKGVFKNYAFRNTTIVS